MTLRLLIVAATVFSACASLPACGGGGSSSGGSPLSTPQPTLAPLVVNPSALSFSLTGTQSFAVTESGYAGAYRITSSDPQVASVPASMAANGGTISVPVTAKGAGTATVTVADAQGQSETVGVVVTLTPVTVSYRGEFADAR
jgi:hypothetical protein